MPPTRISIIGGGLSGLSSAFHLSRRFPAAKVTLLEQSPRVGGWVYSERVRVRDDHGNEAGILLERGPRTLRPNSKAVLELINLLGLTPSLLVVPKTAPAARTRFLHIPGTHGLTALPSSIADMLTSPLGRTMLRAGMAEPFRRYPDSLARLKAGDGDESLDEFLTARLGPVLARTLGSALVHGIYAADSRRLSVRAAFPSLWSLAQDGRGSIVRGMLLRAARPVAPEPKDDYDLGSVPAALQNASVYSFRQGMSTLVNALEDALRQRQNVEVLKDASVAAVQRNDQEDDMLLRTTSGRTVPTSHLVSAIPLPALHSILHQSSLPSLPHLTTNPTSSVTVVNIIFPPHGQPIHPDGFGYLIPRDAAGHVRVLGTVFDSCALAGQDEYASGDAPRFTKLTMMLRAEPGAPPVAQDDALAHLTAHLAPRAPLPLPVFFQAHTMRDCIPTPTVGHVQRTKELREAVRREWGGRLEVLGAGVGGVSVGDCIEQGRQAGKAWSL